MLHLVLFEAITGFFDDLSDKVYASEQIFRPTKGAMLDLAVE